jgi:hypothetical protein
MKSKLFISSLILFITACSSEYDLCLEREKQQYRERNPKASYGQIQSKQSEFEMMCSQYKGK